MILFDGMYSFVSVILSLMALGISNYISKKDDHKYPFGKHVLEPIVIAIKSVAIIVICSYSFVNAIHQILMGGNEVEYGFALIYALISTIGCGSIYFYMKKKSKKLSSELIFAESTQWLMDGVLSAAVLVGFIIAMILSKTPLGFLNKYVDSIMVIMSSAIFIRIPLKTLLSSVKEILSIRANDNISDDIHGLVKGIQEEYSFEESITRVSKMGRTLRIEIDFVYNDATKISDLDDMDSLRERLYSDMKHINYKKWLNVSFTGDKKWAI